MDAPFSGIPITTIQGTSSDTAQSLGDLGAPLSGDVVGAFISCESNDVRYAFGSTPDDDAGTGLGHAFLADEELVLESGAAVRDIQFVSKTAGAHATLQITIYVG